MAWPPWRGQRSQPPARNEAKDQLLDMADRLVDISDEARRLARRLEAVLASDEAEAG